MTNIKDNGLKYVFTASNYIGGANNETEQNSFFNGSDAAKGIINPEYKGQDSEATEHREPLLRVELVDTTKVPNQVVAVGWIKTKILRVQLTDSVKYSLKILITMVVRTMLPN